MSRPSRRRAREAALQLLYQADLSGEDGESARASFWDARPEGDRDAATREFAEALVDYVLADEGPIDAAIDAAARNWDLDRFSRVDLALLRLAVGELLGFPDVPAPVVINEAVEVARRFSDEKSASFINGVLDRVARDTGRLEPRSKAGSGKSPGVEP